MKIKFTAEQVKELVENNEIERSGKEGTFDDRWCRRIESIVIFENKYYRLAWGKSSKGDDYNLYKEQSVSDVTPVERTVVDWVDKD